MNTVDIIIYSPGDATALVTTLSSIPEKPGYRIFVCDSGGSGESEERTSKIFSRNRFTFFSCSDEEVNRAAMINRAIGAGCGDVILLIESGLIINGEFIERGKAAFRTGGKIGQVACRIVQSKGDNGAVIISAGVGVDCDRRTFDPMAGYAADSIGAVVCQVFGASWKCGFFSRQCLESVAQSGEFFDEDFGNPKADVDFAWRSRLLGWRSLYNPYCVATAMGQVNAAMSPEYRRESYRNRYYMILKNDTLDGLFLNFLHMVFIEMALQFYCLLFEPALFTSLIGLLKKLPGMLKKRRKIQLARVISASAFERDLKVFRNPAISFSRTVTSS